MVRSRKELEDLILHSTEDIRKFGVSRLGLFGSFVRDQQNDSSDIDFLVEFMENAKNFDNFSCLADFLEELTGREIELLTPASLSPYIGPKIKAEVKYFAFSD